MFIKIKNNVITNISLKMRIFNYSFIRYCIFILEYYLLSKIKLMSKIFSY
jgi:hypothetical protein